MFTGLRGPYWLLFVLRNNLYLTSHAGVNFSFFVSHAETGYFPTVPQTALCFRALVLVRNLRKFR